MGSDNIIFLKCENCGKNLIQRLPNGLFRFRFGRDKMGRTPVDITIHGNIKIKCFRGTCGHIQIINYFDEFKEI